MPRALFALRRLPPPAKIGVIILLGEETGPAIVAALHEMQRHTIKMDSGASGHGVSLAEMKSDPFYWQLHPEAKAPGMRTIAGLGS